MQSARRYSSDSQKIGPQYVRLPCWPNASAITVLLTRGLKDFITRYVFAGVLIASFFLFELDDVADKVLYLIGYDHDFVSSFPFIRDFHFSLLSSRMVAHANEADFHLLDAFVWLSIFAWGCVFCQESRF